MPKAFFDDEDDPFFLEDPADDPFFLQLLQEDGPPEPDFEAEVAEQEAEHEAAEAEVAEHEVDNLRDAGALPAASSSSSIGGA